MMMMKTMEIVIKAYVYFPSDSCTNGLCRSQTRGVISLEGASSHIKYNCLSNKYACFVCYRVLKSNWADLYKLPKISDSVCCRIPVDLFGTLKLVWKLDFYSRRNSNWTFGEIIGVLLWTEISLHFRFRKITDKIKKSKTQQHFSNKIPRFISGLNPRYLQSLQQSWSLIIVQW